MPLTSSSRSRTALCRRALSARVPCARSSTAWAWFSRAPASTARTPGIRRAARSRPPPRHLLPQRLPLHRLLRLPPPADPASPQPQAVTADVVHIKGRRTAPAEAAALAWAHACKPPPRPDLEKRSRPARVVPGAPEAGKNPWRHQPRNRPRLKQAPPRPVRRLAQPQPTACGRLAALCRSGHHGPPTHPGTCFHRDRPRRCPGFVRRRCNLSG